MSKPPYSVSKPASFSQKPAAFVRKPASLAWYPASFERKPFIARRASACIVQRLAYFVRRPTYDQPLSCRKSVSCARKLPSSVRKPTSARRPPQPPRALRGTTSGVNGVTPILLLDSASSRKPDSVRPPATPSATPAPPSAPPLRGTPLGRSTPGHLHHPCRSHSRPDTFSAKSRLIVIPRSPKPDLVRPLSPPRTTFEWNNPRSI